MAASKSYVITVDDIPRTRRSRHHLATRIVYVGQHTVATRARGAHRAGRHADAQRARLRDAGVRVNLARLDAAWFSPRPDDFSYGGGRHRATPAETRRRRAAVARRSPQAVLVRSCLAAVTVAFVLALVAGAWFSTSDAVALASIVRP